MNTDFQFILIALIAFVVGMMMTWIIMKFRVQFLVEREKAILESEKWIAQEKVKEQEQTVHNLVADKDQLHTQLRELETQNQDLEKKWAVSQHQLTQLEISENKVKTLHDENLRFQKKITELETRNVEERKKTEEKVELLHTAREELKNQFKSLASDIFDEKGKKFSDQNQEKLDTILAPFHAQLQGFKQKVDEVYLSEAKERASLKNELENLKNLNQQLNQEAINLTRALKGDTKKQGNWGELILERVLEQSGLRKGIEYETQGGFRNADNQLLKPDVIIHLPEKKKIIVDSKVSLNAYERFCSSSSSEEQQVKALQEHVQALGKHIKQLSEKDYSSLKGMRSLDFVLMFIPIEPAFMVAVQHDEQLFSQAFQHKIILVTPTTLLATLRTIENIWRYEKQNQNTLAIAEKAGRIYDKFRGFVEDIEKLGKQLQTAQSTYGDAIDKLTRGKGNLVGQVQGFVDLGVKVKKEISPSILEHSDLETLESLPVEKTRE